MPAISGGSFTCYATTLALHNLIFNVSFLVIYWKGRDREKYFYFLVHFPNACNSWGWTRENPETWNSIKVFHVSGRDPRTSASTCQLPDKAQRHNPELKAELRPQLKHSYMGCRYFKLYLNSCRKHLSIHLKVRETEMEREREYNCNHLFSLQIPAIAMAPKPGAGNSIQGSCVGDRSSVVWAIIWWL